MTSYVEPSSLLTDTIARLEDLSANLASLEVPEVVLESLDTARTGLEVLAIILSNCPGGDD